MSKKQNLRNSLIYYLLIPLTISFLISLSVFLLNEFDIIFIEDVIVNPGNHSVNPAIMLGIMSFMLLAGFFGKFDYDLRKILNLDIKFDDEFLQELFEKKYLPLLDGKIKEDDIWHEIPEKNAKKYLINLVELVKKFYNVTDVKFYYKSTKYGLFFSSDITLLPFIIDGKYFAICKTNDSIINEIAVSKKNLIFNNYSYNGENFSLLYDDEEKKLLTPAEMEKGPWGPSTEKEIEFYNKIKNNKELFDKIHSIMKKSYASFWLHSRKRALIFTEFKEYYSKYRNNLMKAKKDFIEYEKDGIVSISFDSFLDLKIKPEFFELAKDLLKVILE
jgi:hypothetical protein